MPPRARSRSIVGAEGQRQHRVHGVIETCDSGPGRGSEAAVIVNASGDEGMGELQEDGAAPAEKDDPLGVDPARDEGIRDRDRDQGLAIEGHRTQPQGFFLIPDS